MLFRILDELSNVHFIRTYFHWNLIESDPDDNKFVDAAIYADAIITTQDKHFNILKSIDFPPTTVIGIDEFLELVKKM
jgi:predicted nucleic acid-binding protein